MQLDLLGLPFPAGSWARPSREFGCIVVWIADPLEACKAGLAAKLKEQGIVLQAAAPLANGLACCLWCPAGVRSLLLSQLPRPRSAGSFTPGNFLPW